MTSDHVPGGERASLQETAIETARQLAALDTITEYHSTRLKDINGSIANLATSMGSQASSLAVMTASLKNIETKMNEATVSGRYRAGLSTQWMLAIMAAAVALIGFLITIATTIVVLVT